MATAFVTGGSGFIGGQAVAAWSAKAGPCVPSPARRARRAAVAELGAEPVRGDLDDADSIAAGAEGCEVAFHLAAHLGDWGRWEDFERGNVAGTQNTLDGCARRRAFAASCTAGPRRR